MLDGVPGPRLLAGCMNSRARDIMRRELAPWYLFAASNRSGITWKQSRAVPTPPPGVERFAGSVVGDQPGQMRHAG